MRAFWAIGGEPPLSQVGLGKYSPAGVGDGIWDRGALLIYKKGFTTDPVSGEVCRALQKILKVDTQPGQPGQPGNQVAPLHLVATTQPGHQRSTRSSTRWLEGG